MLSARIRLCARQTQVKCTHISFLIFWKYDCKCKKCACCCHHAIMTWRPLLWGRACYLFWKSMSNELDVLEMAIHSSTSDCANVKISSHCQTILMRICMYSWFVVLYKIPGALQNLCSRIIRIIRIHHKIGNRLFKHEISVTALNSGNGSTHTWHKGLHARWNFLAFCSWSGGMS